EYLIWGGTVPYVGGVSAGKNFFDGLSEERQEMVKDIATDLNQYIYEMQNEYNSERLDIIKDNKPEINIIELDDEERAAFRELAQPVWDEYVDDVGEVGQEMLDIILEDIDNLQSQ
ncbi:MAG: TRAP transporter substrate-binding protein DctP, partial [Bacillota bacterium]